MNDPVLNWRKSSCSGQGNCVEAANHEDAVLVRDTKAQGTGPVHRYAPPEWRAFVTAVRNAQ